MQYIKLGQSELEVSRVCLGTMTYGQQNTENEAHQQLDYAIERGVNFIDTAEMYTVPPRADTVHRTETMVGNWLKRQDRSKILLATKATGGSRNMTWIRGGGLAFDRLNITEAIDQSLKRLQTDYVDLYQLHWPERNTPMFGQYLFDPEQERNFTPFRETLEVLAELVDAGKVRYIGISNEWPWGLMQFLRVAEDYNLPRIISVQNAYNLINRTFETAMLEACFREQVSLLSYSPLAFGHLSGKYLSDNKARGRINDFPGFGQRYEKPNLIASVQAYAELARQYNVSPATLAQAFVYSRWFVASNIIGATTMQQLKENIDAISFTWSEDLEKALEKIHLTYFNPAP